MSCSDGSKGTRLLAGALLSTFLASLASGHLLAQAPSRRNSVAPGNTPSKSTMPRRPDGHPDLQGVWDYRTATPLERPAEFAGKEFLTDEEVADWERRALARPDGRNPDDPRTDPSVQAPEWLDYGKKMVSSHRSSLIVDPPDGRIPAVDSSRSGEGRCASRGGAQPWRCGRSGASHNVGTLHHARLAGGGAAGRLQQQHPDFPVAGVRRDRDGNDS